MIFVFFVVYGSIRFGRRQKSLRAFSYYYYAIVDDHYVRAKGRVIRSIHISPTLFKMRHMMGVLLARMLE